MKPYAICTLMYEVGASETQPSIQTNAWSPLWLCQIFELCVVKQSWMPSVRKLFYCWSVSNFSLYSSFSGLQFDAMFLYSLTLSKQFPNFTKKINILRKLFEVFHLQRRKTKHLSWKLSLFFSTQKWKGNIVHINIPAYSLVKLIRNTALEPAGRLTSGEVSHR